MEYRNVGSAVKHIVVLTYTVLYVCVYVCVSMCERETGRKRQSKRERETVAEHECWIQGLCANVSKPPSTSQAV